MIKTDTKHSVHAFVDLLCFTREICNDENIFDCRRTAISNELSIVSKFVLDVVDHVLCSLSFCRFLVSHFVESCLAFL